MMEKKKHDAYKAQVKWTTYKPVAFKKRHETINTYVLEDGTLVSVTHSIFAIHVHLDENGDPICDEQGNPHVTLAAESTVKTKRQREG